MREDEFRLVVLSGSAPSPAIEAGVSGPPTPHGRKLVMPQSWTVGRDSVEPKLDFLGKSHGSTELYRPLPSVTDALRKLHLFPLSKAALWAMLCCEVPWFNLLAWPGHGRADGFSSAGDAGPELETMDSPASGEQHGECRIDRRAGAGGAKHLPAPPAPGHVEEFWGVF